MKRGMILLVILVLMPVAIALQLENINEAEFNLGDTFTVKGSVESAFKGGFRINLNCRNVVSLLFKNVTFESNSKFEETVRLFNGEGNCKVIAYLETKNGVVEQVESNQFTITKSLNSTFFSLSDYIVKGELLKFGGSVRKASGKDFSGLVTIIIEGSSAREVFTKEVNNEWEFDFDTVNRQTGNYKVTVKYQDLYGNSEDFNNIVSFKVVNKIDFNLDFENLTYLPGDIVYIKGTLKNFKGDPIDGTAKILFLGVINTQNIKGGALNYEIKISESQAGSEYPLGLKIEDDYGNYGEKSYSLIIKKVPKKLLLYLSKNEISPKEKIEIDSKILDQSSIEIINENGVAISILNPDNEIISKAANKLSYEIDQFAAPGTYTVEGRFDNLTEKETFTIKEVESLNIVLNNKAVSIFNDGNVPYEKEVSFIFDGEEQKYFTEDVSIKPGSTLVYTLEDKVKTGTYGIRVLAGDNEYPLGNLALEDKRSTLRKTGNILTGAVSGINQLNGKSLMDPTALVVLVIILLFAFTLYLIIHKQNKGIRQVGGYIKSIVDSHITQTDSLRSLKKIVKTKGKEKKKVLGILNRYLDSNVARELIYNDKLGIESEKRNISVLFTDIRGFTQLVNEGDPWIIMNMINYYFKSITDLIYKYHGTINKYIGDSVMALFNAPRKVENHLLMALKAGIEISKEIDKLNIKLKERKMTQISVGIGISSGEALIGSFGDRFMEYSALGGCVNLASRLQSYGTKNHVLIDEKTYEAVRDKVEVIEYGIFDIRGIGRMKVYSVTNVY